MKITFVSQEEKDAFLEEKKAAAEKLSATIALAEAAEIVAEE